MRGDALVGRVAQKKKKTAKRRESGTCSEPRRWLVTAPALPQVTCAHHRASPARLKALFPRAGLAPGNRLEVTSLPSLPTLISLQSSSDACSSLSTAGLVFRLQQGDSLSFTGSSSSLFCRSDVSACPLDCPLLQRRRPWRWLPETEE